MFGQMMPGMELMPLILLGLVVGLILLVAGAAWRLTRCLPLRSLNKDTAIVIRYGVAFAVTAVVSWFVFRTWPPIRGEDPRPKIRLGMTKNQVRAILGSPDEESGPQDGEQTWIYRQDWVGLSYHAVRFAGDGRVEYQWLE